MSTDTATMTTAQRAQAEAREIYRASCAAGDPITGAALAERFGRRERWGQERIAEAKVEARTSEPSPAGLPSMSLPPFTPPPPETADEAQEGSASPWWKPWKRQAVKAPPKWSVRKAQKREAKAAQASVRARPNPIASAAPSAETAQAQPRGAAASAWLALVLGVGASVGANVLHTVLVVDGGNTGSIPQVIGAAFWPVALVVAIEVMARVRWPRSIGYTLIRFAGVGAVAGVAAVVSYKHMVGLLTYWGEDPLSAHLGPIAVDGLVTVGALALLAIHKARKES